MADLTVQSSSRSANDLAWSAPTAGTGDTFTNTGREAILVNNNVDEPVTVTIETPATVDGLAITDRIIVVGEGKIALLGPFPRATYNNNEGKLKITCSAVVAVTLAVIRIAG
jgi:hypothetical protein